MKRERVKSSNINSVGYDVDEKILEIEFLTGSVYRYFNVPANIYLRLLEAKSLGGVFHKLVKPNFKFELVPPETLVDERGNSNTKVSLHAEAAKPVAKAVSSHLVTSHRVVRPRKVVGGGHADRREAKPKAE